jgi:predicted nucleotidyltransferase
MEKRSVEAVVRALNDAGVRYMIVGGLAVVAHGYTRFTADVDLILAMDEPNLHRALAALKALDYRPRAPVEMDRFASPTDRNDWVQTKGMTVFSLFSPTHPATEVDLFVQPPLDLSESFSQAVSREISPGLLATFCSVEDLIKLKTLAGRPRDLEDIRQLRARRGEDSQ